MRVTSENLSWDTPFLVLISLGGVLLDIPDDKGLISGSRDEELFILVWSDLLLANLHAGDPAIMALEVSSDAQVVLYELFFVFHASVLKSV